MNTILPTAQPIRIAYLGIRHESNTFAVTPTTYEDFGIIQDLDALRTALGGNPLPADFEVRTVYLANATPGGLVTHSAYARLKAECIASLQEALPLDGVLLDLHGAMEVEGLARPEGLGKPEPDLAAAVRTVVGDAVPVSVSLDLHGNLTQALLDQVNCVTAFRTAPHRDYPDTVGRALRHLRRCVREGLRPRMALVRVPLLIPGEYAMTTAEPARTLYAQLDEIEQQPGLLDASLMIGYAWADRPHSSASVVVVAERDQGRAWQVARAFARQVWAGRHAFGFPGETAEVAQAVQMAMASTVRPVFISDSGDNVTAGGAGDMTWVLEDLIAQDATQALVAGLQDASAVEACKAAGVGAPVELMLGNKIGRPDGVPLRLMATVEHIGGTFDSALVRVKGVRILITATRIVFASRARIAQAAGLDPMQQHIVVVKLGYLMPDLYDHAPRSILALSPGLTDLDLRRFDYHQIERPIFPLDPEADQANGLPD